MFLQHRNDAATVEAHVELARNAVEGAVVENVEVPVARVGPRVDELLRIDSGGRRAGDVADVVGPRTARTQADIQDVLDQGNGAFGLYFADLEIGPRRHMGISAAIALGRVGYAFKLRGLENPIGNAKPAHVGILGRGAVEQAEEPPTEIIVRLGRGIGGSLGFEFFVAVEGVQFALEFLLVGELAARFRHLVLGPPMRRVRTGRLRRRRRGGSAGTTAACYVTRGPRDLQAGHEAFEIALLFGLEITGHRLVSFGIHSAGTVAGMRVCSVAGAVAGL